MQKSENSYKAAKILYEQDLYEESTSMSYYSMFHITLSLFFRVGIKCENHDAAIILLKELFEIDNEKIFFAKKERIDKQYYFDFEITKENCKELLEIAYQFNNQIFDFIDTLNTKKIKNYLDDFKQTYFIQ